MRNFLMPGGFHAAVKAGTLALMVATPTLGAEQATVGFVDRDTIGWRNPLRAGSASAGAAESTNSLRQTVTPVAYEEEATGTLKLRPHKESGGIFEGMFGGGQGQTPTSQPRPIAAQTKPQQGGSSQLQFQSARAKPAPVADAPVFRHMPTFKTNAARTQIQGQGSSAASQRVATAQPSTNRAAGNPINTQPSAQSGSRAGSGTAATSGTAPAAPRTAQLPTQGAGNRVWHQPTYGSAAAAAQNYQQPGASAGTARSQTTTRPSPNM